MNTLKKPLTLNNISKFDKCANCGACYNICPTNAITVKDELFYTVSVNQSKCIECGKCIDVCPVNSVRNVQNIVAGYSAIHNDKEIVARSSSGGAFTALADYVLMQNGVVWGAGYNNNFDNVVFQSTNITLLDNLRRSKYVESLVGDSFKEIKLMLQKGVTVLFCGAPCQVAGLKRFIGENDLLYTVDFSCGGLASHKLYQEWLKDLEKKYKSDVCNVNFRSKKFGWGTHGVRVDFKNGKKYIKPASIDKFFSAFINGKLSVREYCYECQFSDNHYADLILADYWKYKDTYAFENHTGISLILVNSYKGEQIIKKIEKTMQLYEVPLSKANYNIKKTKTDQNRIKRRSDFLKKVQNEGLTSATKTYCLPTKFKSAIYLIRVYIKQIIKVRKK